MEPKWANTACFCVSFPISSFGFTQTLQTPPGHPLCSVWPCLVVWLVPTSCPGCVAFTDQSVLEASIWDLTGRGGSCQSVFPRAHSSLTTSTWMDMPSPGGVSQAEGWMNDLSTFPRNSRGRVSSPRQSLRLPHPPRRLCLPHRCEIRLRRWWQWWFLVSSHQPGWGSLEVRLWRKSAWAQNQRPPPPALPAVTWAETDPLLKLMNWQLDTQLLGVPGPTEHPAWHVRAWQMEGSTAMEDLVSPPGPQGSRLSGRSNARVRLDSAERS